VFSGYGGLQNRLSEQSDTDMLKKIIVARHHGFCMGVKRAINIAEKTARHKTGKVTILKEIVHNNTVVEGFRQQGVGQVDSVDNVSEGTLIISAHGVAPSVFEKAQAKGLTIIDATCPLVSKIYGIIMKIIDDNYYVIHFGDRKHDETEGIIGHAPDRITIVSSKEELANLPEWKDRKLGLTSQTTASQESFSDFQKEAKKKWPHIKVFDTICNATDQRQKAVVDIAPRVDMVLVVGSKTSANSKRLADISKVVCGRGILIDSAKEIDSEWFTDDGKIEKVGVTAGASTPEFLVDEVIRRLVAISNGLADVEFAGEENLESRE
jgi:(E)-4-hydroxy-3-methyl-but-2-enyl pyrophosphate reductase